MALFLVSYDLHYRRDYGPLTTALLGYGGVKLLESVWLVDLAVSAATLRDALVGNVDSDDSVAVLQLASPGMWATTRAMPQGTAWLKQKNP